MSKWKCEICNSSFENFEARGFDNKIYCPLCYYKKLYKDTELERKRLNKELEKYKYTADELNALELFGENEYLHKEIEMLKTRISKQRQANKKLQEKYDLVHTIIKEVREYIEEHIEWEVDGEECVDYTAWINFKGTSYEYFVKGLLEILEKENI